MQNKKECKRITEQPDSSSSQNRIRINVIKTNYEIRVRDRISGEEQTLSIYAESMQSALLKIANNYEIIKEEDKH